MSGLSWVDYSDIKVEFDELEQIGARLDLANAKNMSHMTPGSFGVLKVYEKSNGLVAQATRAEREVYGYHAPRKQACGINAYGYGLVGTGFVDAINSVVKDVDVYDPAGELEAFMKYMIIRSDFIGGACPKCKCTVAYIINFRDNRSDTFTYRYKCKACHWQYTPKSGALFDSCRIPLPTLYDITRMSLDPRGVSTPEIAARTKITQLSAWNLRTLIRGNSVNAERWKGDHDKSPEQP